ncbi:MAG: GTPase domain-containing protein [Nitrospirae bacterium]|nr:GTPase domain-containing protein [Nitrospirota bacterium]
MALFNYTSREINAKVVYYGPGLSGKTTNIQSIYDKVAPEKKGKLVTLPTYTDRTLFFDFFPLDAGEIKGYKMRFHLYTVPGQVFYNATRRLVLKGADGVVFVADSQEEMIDSNLESMANLRKNLADLGIGLDDFPFVIQYNKRDLPRTASIEVLNRSLNPKNVPFFSASAAKGEGVLETLTAISRLVLKDLKEGIETGQPKRRPTTPSLRQMEMEPKVVDTPGRTEKGEDVRQWVREDFAKDLAQVAPLPVGEGETVSEVVLDTSLQIRLRVVTSVKEGHVTVERVEVAGVESKGIQVR